MDSMIINNSKHRHWGYHLRDTGLVALTLSLWLAFAFQGYLAFTQEAFLSEQAYLLAIAKFTAIDFVVVFLLFHVWVCYERRLSRGRERHMLRQAPPPLELPSQWQTPLTQLTMPRHDELAIERDGRPSS